MRIRSLINSRSNRCSEKNSIGNKNLKGSQKFLERSTKDRISENSTKEKRDLFSQKSKKYDQ